MIGRTIKFYREKKGLTLSELAERANVSKSYLSNIERDLKQNPSIHVIEKISFVLDVEVKRLLKHTDAGNSADEWDHFVHDLKESGITKDDMENYKIILDFLRWQNQLHSEKE